MEDYNIIMFICLSAGCKVAPLIVASIPRFELSAAVTGVSLALTFTQNH